MPFDPGRAFESGFRLLLAAAVCVVLGQAVALAMWAQPLADDFAVASQTLALGRSCGKATLTTTAGGRRS